MVWENGLKGGYLMKVKKIETIFKIHEDDTESSKLAKEFFIEMINFVVPKKYKVPYAYWKKVYPKIKQTEDMLLDMASRGGIVWSNPKFEKGDIIHNVTEIDMNQSYPATLAIRQPYFPYGNAQRVTAQFLKDMGPVPGYRYFYVCIVYWKKEIIKYFTHNIIPYDDQGKYIVCFCDMEYEILQKCYCGFKIWEFLDVYRYPTNRNLTRNFFQHYYDQYIKNEQDPEKRKYAKKKANIFIGYLGMPYKRKRKGTASFIYRPLAVFARAFQRMKIINLMFKIGLENILLVNTDSFLIKDYDCLSADVKFHLPISNQLGEFKMPFHNIDVKFINNICFAVLKNGDIIKVNHPEIFNKVNIYSKF